jgi:hypothetical protein
MDPNPDPGGPKNVDPDPEHWFEPFLGSSGEGEGVGGGEAVVAGPHSNIVAHPTALPGIAVRLQQQHQSKISKILTFCENLLGFLVISWFETWI